MHNMPTGLDNKPANSSTSAAQGGSQGPPPGFKGLKWKWKQDHSKEQEERDRRAREELERQQREEQERKAQEEQKAREEQARKEHELLQQKAEEERKEREEAERQASLEQQRKEEQERKAREDAAAAASANAIKKRITANKSLDDFEDDLFTTLPSVSTVKPVDKGHVLKKGVVRAAAASAAAGGSSSALPSDAAPDQTVLKRNESLERKRAREDDKGQRDKALEQAEQDVENSKRMKQAGAVDMDVDQLQQVPRLQQHGSLTASSDKHSKDEEKPGEIKANDPRSKQQEPVKHRSDQPKAQQPTEAPQKNKSHKGNIDEGAGTKPISKAGAKDAPAVSEPKGNRPHVKDEKKASDLAGDKLRPSSKPEAPTRRRDSSGKPMVGSSKQLDHREPGPSTSSRGAVLNKGEAASADAMQAANSQLVIKAEVEVKQESGLVMDASHHSSQPRKTKAAGATAGALPAPPAAAHNSKLKQRRLVEGPVEEVAVAGSSAPSSKPVKAVLACESKDMKPPAASGGTHPTTRTDSEARQQRVVECLLEETGPASSQNVDLGKVRSFKELWTHLTALFPTGLPDRLQAKLIYLDNDGDWMLVTPDEHWATFVNSARKLLISNRC